VKCVTCGFRTTKADAAMQSDGHYNHDLSYKDEITEGSHERDLCGDCAISYMENKIRSQEGYVDWRDEDPDDSQDESDADLGRAIQMMNGDEDYDDDFVQEHL
jgi:hypothetical protein